LFANRFVQPCSGIKERSARLRLLRLRSRPWGPISTSPNSLDTSINLSISGPLSGGTPKDFPLTPTAWIKLANPLGDVMVTPLLIVVGRVDIAWGTPIGIYRHSLPRAESEHFQVCIRSFQPRSSRSIQSTSYAYVKGFQGREAKTSDQVILSLIFFLAGDDR